MDRERLRRTGDTIVRPAHANLDSVTFAAEATESLRRVIGFDRSCWCTDDPGAVLCTGGLNQGLGCSGAWLARYASVEDDVNQWWFLARSGRRRAQGRRLKRRATTEIALTSLSPYTVQDSFTSTFDKEGADPRRARGSNLSPARRPALGGHDGTARWMVREGCPDASGVSRIGRVVSAHRLEAPADDRGVR